MPLCMFAQFDDGLAIGIVIGIDVDDGIPEVLVASSPWEATR